MSNTTSAIKGFMNFPTRFANGETIANEDGGPAFLAANVVDEITPTQGALAGIKIIVKHTTNEPTRSIEFADGERPLVPLVTAWARPELRETALVPGPEDHREGPAIVYKGLARFKGGANMEFGKPANIEVPNFNTIDEIVVVSPHAVTFKRDGADDLVIKSSGSARADQVFSQEPVEYVDSVPVYELTYTGEVVGLPDPVPGRVYVVSMILAQALLALGIKRNDVVSPNYVPALGGAPSVTLHI